MTTIHVPRLNDGPVDFDRLAQIARSVNEHSAVRLDFADCDFIRYTGVAVVGGLIRHGSASGTPVIVDEATIRPAVLGYLRSVGFPFVSGHKAVSATAVPYFEQRTADRQSTTQYLDEHWLRRAPGRPSLSPGLARAMVSQVWEIFLNAMEHADSRAGIFACGQFFPNLKDIALGIVDYGVGIPARVQGHLAAPGMPDSNAMEWAFQPGNSTSSSPSVPRGLGLDLLQEFVTKNGGSLHIVSNGARASLERGRLRFEEQSSPFPGSLTCIRLRCDDALHYSLASERESGWIF